MPLILIKAFIAPCSQTRGERRAAKCVHRRRSTSEDHQPVRTTSCGQQSLNMWPRSCIVSAGPTHARPSCCIPSFFQPLSSAQHTLFLPAPPSTLLLPPPSLSSSQHTVLVDQEGRPSSSPPPPCTWINEGGGRLLPSSALHRRGTRSARGDSTLRATVGSAATRRRE